MTYKLGWTPPAVNQLTALFIRSADKDAITLCSAGADKVLARDPMEQDESRETLTKRLWFYRPLCLDYTVDEAAKAVFVVGVKGVGR